jgi:hypothetical protein
MELDVSLNLTDIQLSWSIISELRGVKGKNDSSARIAAALSQTHFAAACCDCIYVLKPTWSIHRPRGVEKFQIQVGRGDWHRLTTQVEDVDAKVYQGGRKVPDVSKTGVTVQTSHASFHTGSLRLSHRGYRYLAEVFMLYQM